MGDSTRKPRLDPCPTVVFKKGGMADYIAWEGTVKLVEQVSDMFESSPSVGRIISNQVINTNCCFKIQRTLALSDVVQELASSAQSCESQDDADWIKEQGEELLEVNTSDRVEHSCANCGTP